MIHPHVPVGIPCYDFTPVTCPTLGGPLPCGLGYRLQVLQTPMAWRAVCTTPGNVFTPTFWFGITSNSNFMRSSYRPQSGLRSAFRDWLHVTMLQLVVPTIVARLYHVAARCTDHCSTPVALDVRGMMIWRHPHLPPAYTGSLLRVLN